MCAKRAAVMRIGVDIVSVSRIAHSLSVSTKFASKVFALGERESARRMPECRAHAFLAGRFAVKEAVLKALHARLDDEIALCDIETRTAEDGCPELHLSASALCASELLNLSLWQVSISHENDLAIAFVVAH
jgi:holo-[acyl-carrier protein] synthase